MKNDKQKIAIFILALACNFTFLATARTPQRAEREFKKCSPEHAKEMDSMKPDHTRMVPVR